MGSQGCLVRIKAAWVEPDYVAQIGIRPRNVLQTQTRSHAEAITRMPLIVAVELELVVSRWCGGCVRSFGVATVSSQQQVCQRVSAILGPERGTCGCSGAVSNLTAVPDASILVFVAVDEQATKLQGMIAAHPGEIIADLPAARIDVVRQAVSAQSRKSLH